MGNDESKPEELTADERRTLADFFAAALAQLAKEDNAQG